MILFYVPEEKYAAIAFISVGGIATEDVEFASIKRSAHITHS
jgi:hypothetical protein